MSDFINWLRTEKGTLIRTILQYCSYVNQIVALVGQTSFASNPAYQWLSLAVTIVITAVNWWENNDFTSFAKFGTGVLDALEDGKITIEEVYALLKKSEHPMDEK